MGARRMLRAMTADLAGEVLDLLPAALADEPDAVHQLRTAVRRLRTCLSQFRRGFDKPRGKDLRRRLKELSAVLAPPRDLEVRAEQCAELLADLHAAGALDDAERGALATCLVEPLHAAHARAHAELVAWHDSRDAAQLLADLAVWAHDPPVRGSRSARAIARGALLDVAGEARDLGREATTSLADEIDGARRVGADDLDRLHELRKSGRALRHVADAVGADAVVADGPLPRKATRRLGKRGHRVQSLLGDHRDALLLADYVTTVAAGAGAEEWAALHDVDLASYRRVAAEAERRGAQALADLPEAVARLGDARRRFRRKSAKK